jgi:iron(III) transport system substrate-binding protein
MTTLLKQLAQFGILLVLASALVGCSILPAPRGTAPPTGRLVILGSANEEFVRGMARAFELETGIRTSYVRLSAGQAIETLRAERSAPRYSVWWGGGADAYIAADQEGLLEPYRPRGAAKIPRQYKDDTDHWTGVYVGVLAFAVNTRVLAERGLPMPESWADLANPVYRGQISMAHPATSGTAYTVLATIMQLNGKDVERGFSDLQALHHNIRAYERAGAAPGGVVGTGEAAIGISFAHDIVAAIGEDATTVKIVYPTEGTGYEIGAMALVKNAPDPDSGRRFMDWAMGERAQELGPLFTSYQIPTNPDAKVPRQSVKLSAVKTIDFDFEWAGQNRNALVDRFSATIAPPPPGQ